MKRRLSKEGRKKISEAAKRRWEKYKATQSTTEPVVIRKKRRSKKQHRADAADRQLLVRMIADLVRALPDERLLELCMKAARKGQR